MTRRRDSEDILHPERVYYRLLRDYTDGRLDPKRTLLRAVVTASAKFVGELESEPPCPIGSVRARIYTYAMDSNLPNDALTIFYPLFPGDIPQPGEHVYVMFEDENMSSGLWVSRVPNYTDINLANPDENPAPRARNSADAFEGTQPSARTPSTSQYHSVPLTSQRQENTVRSFEEQENSIWVNKRVLLIGDSMIEGPPGIHMEREINNRGGQVTRDGRAGWGVLDWLRGSGPEFRAGRERGSRARTGPKLNDLISQFNPDIVIIALGGNDWSRSNNENYSSKVLELWNQAQGVETRFWVGPPSVPIPYPNKSDWNEERRESFRRGRARAEQTIAQAIRGDFIKVSDVTNVTEGRTADGIHFRTNSVPREYIMKVVNR